MNRIRLPDYIKKYKIKYPKKLQESVRYLSQYKLNGKRLNLAAIFLLLILFLIVTTTVSVLILPNGIFKKNIKTFSTEGGCITDGRVTELVKKEGSRASNLRVVKKFPEDSKLYSKGDSYFIQPGDSGDKLELNPEYPVFLNNGAYLYLYHNKFNLVSSKLTVKACEADTFIGDGAVFNKAMQRSENEDIVLLQLTNDLCINTQELKIDNQGRVEIISANSILKLGQKGITCYQLWNEKAGLAYIEVIPELTMMEFKGNKVTYNYLIKKINEAEKSTGSEEVSISEFRLQANLYQYFMGARYDYKGEKVFYRSDNGFVMETGGDRAVIYSLPFYFADERKILLPADYVIVEPKVYTMRKQPAMSQIYADENAVYTRLGEKLRSYTDMFLYDGRHNYIFFNQVDIVNGDERISVTPFTSVSLAEDGLLEIYKYDGDEYISRNVKGYESAFANMKDGTKVNLSSGVMYTVGGKEQILFSEPSQLEEVK